MREFLRTHLPDWEPLGAAFLLFVIVALACVAIEGVEFFRGDRYYKVVYFSLVVPIVGFYLVKLALLFFAGLPVDSADVWVCLAFGLFIGAGLWIYWSEHEWQNALLVPMTVLAVVLNLCAVARGLWFFYRWGRDWWSRRKVRG